MTRWTPSSAALVLALSAAACGGAQPSKGAASPTAVTASSTPTATSDDPDLTPKGAPEDLLLVARWKAPAATVDELLAWVNMPINWRMLMGQALPPEAKGLADEALALDAPFDLAMTLGAGASPEPKPKVVFSIGLRSAPAAAELARAMELDVEDLGRGMYAVGPSDDLECIIAPAAGVAPARLVCGEDESHLDALLPYVTRGLPLESFGDQDLHVRLRAAPLRVYGPLMQQGVELGLPVLLGELSFDDPAFDRALADAVRGLTKELGATLEDLDAVTFDMDLDEAKDVANMTFAAQFGGTKSWVARGIVDAKARSHGAPKDYWALPHDVGAASYAGAAAPARYETIRATSAALVDALLNQAKMPASVRKDVRYIVDNTATSSAVRLSVQGSVPATTEPKVEGVLGEALANLDQSWGWNAIGYVGEAPKGFTDYFDTWVRVYNDPALEKALKEKDPSFDRKVLPKVTSRAVATLGAGAKLYQIVLPLDSWTGESDAVTDGAKAKSKAKNERKIVLVVMPDGKNTWVAFSTNEKVLLENLAKLKKAPKTLEGRAGLEALRSSTLFSGGFMTLRRLTESSLASILKMDQAALERLFAGMPNHGETPILSTMTYSNDKGPRLEITMTAPKAIVQDAAAAVPALMASSLQFDF